MKLMIFLVGSKVHLTILTSPSISPGTKQDDHSLATQGSLIISTIGGLPGMRPQPFRHQYSVLATIGTHSQSTTEVYISHKPTKKRHLSKLRWNFKNARRRKWNMMPEVTGCCTFKIYPSQHRLWTCLPKQNLQYNNFQTTRQLHFCYSTTI